MPIGTAKLSIAMACHISTTYQLATTVGTGNLVKTALHANLPAIQLQNTGNSHHLALPFHWVKPKKKTDLLKGCGEEGGHCLIFFCHKVLVHWAFGIFDIFWFS